MSEQMNDFPLFFSNIILFYSVEIVDLKNMSLEIQVVFFQNLLPFVKYYSLYVFLYEIFFLVGWSVFYKKDYVEQGRIKYIF